jgi:hypothetical protein
MVLVADNEDMTIIFLIAILALIVLAGLYGVDSRPHEPRQRSNF